MTSDPAAGAVDEATGEVTFFGDPAMDLMAGVIFELAAQLHEERAARLALQSALLTAGVLDAGAVAELLDGKPVDETRLAQEIAFQADPCWPKRLAVGEHQSGRP